MIERGDSSLDLLKFIFRARSGQRRQWPIVQLRIFLRLIGTRSVPPCSFDMAKIRGADMCDYSLERTASRAAHVGDQLRIQSFQNTTTRGFADIQDRSTAVCLRPGTELAFESAVRYQPKSFWPWRTKTAPSQLARFRQIDTDNPHKHHDALELADGTVVLLNSLVFGQRAVVLQLPREQGTRTDHHVGASSGQKVEETAAPYKSQSES
jgi:hypothetical protein